ncbi:hypothetical protein JTE90_025334 [Oedothorax gibbosus]|uniref:CAF1B/HIR1 beta-propeller domain-containing protein n=1 Tax=Oedothorax gibbosus TaxID=931172 RepID=A0AAV6V5P4_9ARAC|nr:hypothetical protein JTE90_025334 [Oedothorax gibbosus]
MKCQVPQISWHSRDPVLSVDFQPGKQNIQRLATGGTDSHVLIWYITYLDNKSIKLECASDLYRHNKSVNAVRFSSNGELLASGDDEGAMFIWQLKDRDSSEAPKDEENVNQEDWYPLKLLRGHLQDIYDVSWSADSNFLVSASLDNTAIVWDMQKFQKLHIYSDSKGYVQGVAWDPLNVFIASVGSDRALRFLNVATKKTTRVQRAPWSVTTEKGSVRAHLFYDNTLQSYYRRLCFTPDGELLLVPSGILERDEEKSQNTTYVFSRHSLTKPVAQLPTGDKYTVAARCNPLLFKLRRSPDETDKENQTKSMIDLPYRMVFAVAANESVLLYDTEQLLPFAYVSNIHYTHLTDLSWSSDGRILCASSTDGYCSFLIFTEDELGEVYVPPPTPVKEVIPSSDKKPEASPLAEKVPGKTSTASESDAKVEDSPKIAPSPIESSKPDKKPNKFSIKNFFASPKGTSPKPTSLVAKADALEKSPEPGSSTNSSETKVQTFSKGAETMEDDCIEVVFEGKSVEKPPKCKTELKFSNGKTTKNVSNEEVKSSSENASEIPIAHNPKPAKVPNRGTITNFFVSPKAQLSAKSSKVASKDKCKTPDKASPIITLSSPEEVAKSSAASGDGTSMEVDDSTSTTKPEATVCESEDKATPIKSKIINPDLIDCSAVLSFDDSKSTDGIAENVEADWKLELSQDDEVPMETAPPEPVAKIPKAKPSASVDQKPKRRIPLITLSKTLSSSSSKL